MNVFVMHKHTAIMVDSIENVPRVLLYIASNLIRLARWRYLNERAFSHLTGHKVCNLKYLEQTQQLSSPLLV